MSSPTYDYDNVPAKAPPPGQTSNLVDPPSRARNLLILDGVFFGLMGVAVLVRFLVRCRLKIWGWDDLACVFAVIGSIAHLVTYTQMIDVGFGRHIWDIPASWLIKTSNVTLLSSNGVVYPFTIFFIKLTILLSFLRLFGVNRRFRIMIYATIGVCLFLYLGLLSLGIVSLTTCNGLDAISNPFCKAYSGPITLLSGSINVVTDFWILVLPVPILWKLDLARNRKIGVYLVFMAGLAACATSLARLISFAVHYRSSDNLWDQALNAMFTTVEINVAIAISCVSTFPSFFVQVRTYVESATSTIRQRLASSHRSSDSEADSETILGKANRDRDVRLEEIRRPVTAATQHWETDSRVARTSERV